MTLQHGVQFNVSQQPVQQTLERSSTVIGLIHEVGAAALPAEYVAPFNVKERAINIPFNVTLTDLGGATSVVSKAVDAIRRQVSCPIVLVLTESATTYVADDEGLEAFLNAGENLGYEPNLIVPLLWTALPVSLKVMGRQ